MATTGGFGRLNKTFNEAVLGAIGYKQEGENWVIKDAGQSADKLALREELKRQNTLTNTQIDQLADQDNKARKDIMDLLKKEVPSAGDIDRLKDQFENHHKALKAQLNNLHEQQYEQFELALENSVFSLKERRDFLIQVKGAQQAQLVGLDNRAKYDQQRLDSLNLETMAEHRDQKFSAYVLNLAQEKEEAIGKYYRPSIFSTLKQLAGKAGPGYDEVGEVERERASGFSAAEDLKWDTDKQQWRAKKVWEEEQKKQATTVGVRKGGEREWGKDWVPLEEDADYLLNRKEIKLTDLPSAGIMKHIGPVKLLEKFTPLLDEPSLKIQLGQRVDENKKKGIPATDDAILCSVARATSPEQKIVVIQTLMHTARAKGWSSVEIGYDIPESLQNEAYLAARRVGYKDKDILVRGKPMLVDDELKAKGNSARALIEDAFPLQTPQPDSNINAVILKLTGTIPYDLNLNPTKFFTLTSEQQKQLFQKANIDQQATIIADCAFDQKLLDKPEREENYMNFVIPPQGITDTQKEILFKQLLDAVAVANKNPDRAFEIFNNKVPDPIKQGVFDRLEPETAAKLLMRLPLAQARTFFHNIHKPNMSPDKTVEALNKQIKILEAPGLPNEMIYHLYREIPRDLRENALKNLVTTPNGVGVASVIVAQLFLNGKPDWAIQRLLEMIENLPDPQKRNVIDKVYEALPKASRVRVWNNINFVDALLNYETEHPGSTSDIRAMYLARHSLVARHSLGFPGPEQLNSREKQSDAKIAEQIDLLTDAQADQQRAGAEFLYSRAGVDSTEIAAKLLQSASAVLAKQLFTLVGYARENSPQDQDRVRLNGIVNHLGPNVVGKVLVEWLNVREGVGGATRAAEQNAKAAAEKLVGLLYQRENYELLANVLQVCFNHGKMPRLPDALINPQDPAEIGELVKLLSHIKQPEFTKGLLGQKDGPSLVNILQAITNPEEKIKIFQHLPTDLDNNKQEAVYNEYSKNFTDDNLKQQRTFFAYLPLDKQQAYITNYLAQIMRANDPVRSPAAAANQAVACLNNAYLTVERRGELRNVLNNTEYQLIIDRASKPTAGFLKEYLVRTIDGGPLDAKFRDIVDLSKPKFQGAPQTQQERQDSYLYIVGEAVAMLNSNQQVSLLVGQALAIDPSAAVAVQASALVHLVNSGNQDGAKKLLAEIVKPTNGIIAPALATKITDLRAGLSESVSKALQQLIAAPPAPAAAPPAAQNQV